jgi:hypothetical protein
MGGCPGGSGGAGGGGGEDDREDDITTDVKNHVLKTHPIIRSKKLRRGFKGSELRPRSKTERVDNVDNRVVVRKWVNGVININVWCFR